jgi:hypothetical protein
MRIDTQPAGTPSHAIHVNAAVDPHTKGIDQIGAGSPPAHPPTIGTFATRLGSRGDRIDAIWPIGYRAITGSGAIESKSLGNAPPTMSFAREETFRLRQGEA